MITEQYPLMEEIKSLRSRNQKLAEDKAYLSLIVRLIEQLNPLTGINDMINGMMSSIISTIGGTNILFWYWLDNELHYVDFAGRNERCHEIEDPLARQASETQQFVEQTQDVSDALLHNSHISGVWTWAFPLLLGQERIGVIKLENLHLNSKRLSEYLPLFFGHVALLLGNELRNILRQRAEAELREKTLELDHYFNNSLDLFCIADLHGNIRKLNPVWEKALGYRLDDLKGHRFIDFIHPDDVESTLTAIATLTAQRPLLNFINRYRHKEGGYRWIEWKAQPEGSMIYAAARDITERKLAEEQLQLAASVFAHSQEGIMITDAENRIVDVNAAFSTLTGYDHDEVIGKNPKLLSSGRHDRDFYAQLWQALREQSAWSGEIWNCRKSGEIYPEQLLINAIHSKSGKLLNYLGVFTDITRIKAHEAELNHVAHYDTLTGLPNRRLLADRLEQAIARALRKNQVLAICFLDLDGFKPVNDRYGHAAGDRLLIEIATRLQDEMRGDDTVARLGGDEFVLLFNEVGGRESVERMLDRIQERICAPVTLDGHPVTVSASLGVTLSPPDIAEADGLMRHADQAMYLAKESGKRRTHFFDLNQDRQAAAQREAQQRVVQGLKNIEFVLYYQPKIDLRNAEIIGAEALIRWQHPDRGLLIPGDFLHFIANSPLDTAVGEWVIDAALAQIALWNKLGLNLKVSVNIGTAHLQIHNFAERLQVLLARHPTVAAQQLELEIQVSAAIANIEHIANNLAACQALGVLFALDNFGASYSTLAYFRRLPIGTLKIDQVFVRDMLDDPEDLGIVESVIRLAQAFNRPVLGEGVESLEHGVMLLRIGCHLAQGYAIARPMPAAQLPPWIEQWQTELVWHNLAQTAAAPNEIVLLVAAASHRKWVDGIERYLRSYPGSGVVDMDVNQCSFGRWYHGSGANRYGNLAEFIQIKQPHIYVHSLATELVKIASKDDRSTALQRLPELYAARDHLLSAIDTLITHLRTV